MVLIIIASIMLLFGFVVLIGAPYVPTLRSQQQQALDMLALKKGQTVLDIGCGDGRFLLAAAKRGYKAVGIEANPLLVVIARLVCWRYRQQVTVRWGNMWHIPWSPADGIYVFLHSRFMHKFDTKISQEYASKRVKVVSYAFTIPGKKPTKATKALYLYDY